MTVAKNSYGEVLPDEWDEVGEMRCVLSALNTLRDDYRRWLSDGVGIVRMWTHRMRMVLWSDVMVRDKIVDGRGNEYIVKYIDEQQWLKGNRDHMSIYCDRIEWVQ